MFPKGLCLPLSRLWTWALRRAAGRRTGARRTGTGGYILWDPIRFLRLQGGCRRSKSTWLLCTSPSLEGQEDLMLSSCAVSWPTLEASLDSLTFLGVGHAVAAA